MVPETTRFYFYKDNNSFGYENYAFFEDDGYIPETLGNYLSMHQNDLPTKEGYILKGRTNTQGGTQIFPDETSIWDGYCLSRFSFFRRPVWELVPVVPKVIIHGAVGTRKAIKSIVPPWTPKTYEQLKEYTDITELLAELNGHSSEYYLSLYNSTDTLTHLSDAAYVAGGTHHSSDGNKYLGVRGGISPEGFTWKTFLGKYIGYNGHTGVWFGRITRPDAP